MTAHVLSPIGNLDAVASGAKKWELIKSFNGRGKFSENIFDPPSNGDYKMVRIKATAFNGADFSIACHYGFRMRAVFMQEGYAPGGWNASQSGYTWDNFGTSTHRQFEIVAGWGGGQHYAGRILLDYGFWSASGEFYWNGLVSLKQDADKWFGVTVEGLRA